MQNTWSNKICFCPYVSRGGVLGGGMLLVDYPTSTSHLLKPFIQKAPPCFYLSGWMIYLKINPFLNKQKCLVLFRSWDYRSLIFYNLHSTLYTLHSTLYTLHSTLYTLHSTLLLLFWNEHITCKKEYNCKRNFKMLEGHVRFATFCLFKYE